MSEESGSSEPDRVRIGAVNYLNAQPLTFELPRLAPNAEILVDYPSRLADGLIEGRLDVALVPSIECFCNPGLTIVSDACVACDGPVRSVKLCSRVPVQQIRTLALDEGSRASSAMTLLLLKQQFHLEPELKRLPIGASPADSDADAVMLIGDRAIQLAEDSFEFIWDMGRQWSQWIGLPFVFAMWIARSDVSLHGLREVFTAARDRGVDSLAEIARREAPLLGVPEEECLSYLRDHLIFRLGPRERQGLQTFQQLAVQCGLAPTGVELVFSDQESAR